MKKFKIKTEISKFTPRSRFTSKVEAYTKSSLMIYLNYDFKDIQNHPQNGVIFLIRKLSITFLPWVL